MGFNRDGGRGGFGGRSGGNRFGGGSRGGGFGGGFSRGRDSGPREMFDATCSTCGKACQVPFRPTGTKPVLCSDCFGKSDSGNRFGGSQSSGSSAQMTQINAKLDKIIAILKDLELDVDEEDDQSTEETDEEIDVKPAKNAEESEDDFEEDNAEEDVSAPTEDVEEEL